LPKKQRQKHQQYKNSFSREIQQEVRRCQR